MLTATQPTDQPTVTVTTATGCVASHRALSTRLAALAITSWSRLDLTRTLFNGRRHQRNVPYVPHTRTHAAADTRKTGSSRESREFFIFVSFSYFFFLAVFGTLGETTTATTTTTRIRCALRFASSRLLSSFSFFFFLVGSWVSFLFFLFSFSFQSIYGCFAVAAVVVVVVVYKYME